MIRLFLALCFALPLHGSFEGSDWDNDLLLEYSLMYFQPFDTNVKLTEFRMAWKEHTSSSKKLETFNFQSELDKVSAGKNDSFGKSVGDLTNNYFRLFRVYKRGCDSDKRNGVLTYQNSLNGIKTEKKMSLFYDLLTKQEEVSSRIKELRKKVAVMCNRCMRSRRNKYIVNEQDMRFLIILVKIVKSFLFIF